MNCQKSILSLGWYHEVYHNFSTPTPRIKMQLQTILNRVEKQKGFVYSKAPFNENGELEVELCPRRNSKAICSGCGNKGPTYDHTSIRRFQYVPLWGIAVFSWLARGSWTRSPRPPVIQSSKTEMVVMEQTPVSKGKIERGCNRKTTRRRSGSLTIVGG